MIPKYDIDTIPQFTQIEVMSKLKAINPKKAVAEGDIPPKKLKTLFEQISTPLTDIINSSIKQGVWPQMWREEKNCYSCGQDFSTKIIKKSQKHKWIDVL